VQVAAAVVLVLLALVLLEAESPAELVVRLTAERDQTALLLVLHYKGLLPAAAAAVVLLVRLELVAMVRSD
jgi:hypothetical protein